MLVSTWTWILTRRELPVFDVNGGLKNFAHGFGRLEVTDRRSSLNIILVWIVKSWAHSVETSTRIHVLIHFFRRDRRRFLLIFDDRVLVFLRQVLFSRFVQV